MNSEHELLQELKKGVPQAYEHLYKQHYRMIASLISKMGGNPLDAEDVFQEALFVLVKKIREPNFELTAKISTLIYAIARNIWLKKSQKESKELSVSDDGIFENLTDALEDNIDHQEKELMIAVVLDNINALDDECKKVIRMTFFKKMSHAEIAEEMGYAVQFIKVKKFRCLGYLRKMVGDSPFFNFQGQ